MSTYVEQSRKVLESLDPEEIGSMRVGEPIYEDPWLSCHPLGTVLVGGETLHLGVELAKTRLRNKALFMNNLRQINFLAGSDSKLVDYAPSFIGLLIDGLSGHDAHGALMEDVTEGGRYKLEPHSVPRDLLQKSAQLHFARGGPRAIKMVEANGRLQIAKFYPAVFAMDTTKTLELDALDLQAQAKLAVKLPVFSSLHFSLKSLDQTAG